ncbi:hypothetical protein EON67_08875 [archaeon]|nr:MAG: hypothetical protein EON67_08875 [archaeon]
MTGHLQTEFTVIDTKLQAKIKAAPRRTGKTAADIDADIEVRCPPRARARAEPTSTPCMPASTWVSVHLPRACAWLQDLEDLRTTTSMTLDKERNILRQIAALRMQKVRPPACLCARSRLCACTRARALLT